MDIRALFGLSALMSFVAFGIVTKLYIWPRLRMLPRENALALLVVPHTFRLDRKSTRLNSSHRL